MSSDTPAWLRRGPADDLAPAAGEAEAAGHPAEDAGQAGGEILFVCTGNICRSAFAQCYLESLGAPTPPVSSAGIHALVGHGMDPPMASELRALGGDPATHRAQQATGRMLHSAALIVVFDPTHVDWILSEDATLVTKVAALGQLSRVLRESLGEQRLSPAQMADLAHSQRSESTDSDWITDPYLRGQTAAHRTALAISNAVDVLHAHLR